MGGKLPDGISMKQQNHAQLIPPKIAHITTCCSVIKGLKIRCQNTHDSCHTNFNFLKQSHTMEKLEFRAIRKYFFRGI